MQPPTQGYAVEDYARRLAGGLGVADFVYHPVQVQRGQATRELGDGLLVVSDDGLILQVKSRDWSTGADDSPEKAQAWCLKKGQEAQRQGAGSRRSLRTGVHRVRSLRGFERTLPGSVDWPTVVILDHPTDPQPVFPASADTLFIALDDWRTLHRMVRSTAGIHRLRPPRPGQRHRDPPGP